MTTKKVEPTAQIKDTANAYLDRLLQTHERFAEAVASTRDRSARVTDKLVETVIAGQRDALTLGKAVVSEPTAHGKNMEAFLHSLTAAQERALELAKVLYRTSSEVTADLRAVATGALASNKALGQPFEKLMQAWTPAAK